MNHESKQVLVRFETELGNIDIRVNRAAAPNTARYFLELVDAGQLDDVTFHRSGASIVSGSDKPQIIEGGAMGRSLTGEDRRPLAEVGLPLLENFETTSQSGLRHVVSAVSLARDLAGTGHAIADVFICLGEAPEFDEGGRDEPDTRGFPVFGSVESGMDVVTEIANGDRSGETRVEWLKGQILAIPIKIVRTVRLS